MERNRICRAATTAAGRCVALLCGLWILCVGQAALAQGDEDSNSKRLPASFVTATNLLFADGLSDPLGGVYRSITVRVSTFTGNEQIVVATHGWVLPSDGAGDAARAVAWNGLTYPVLADHGPADLHADVAALFVYQAKQWEFHGQRYLMMRDEEGSLLDIRQLFPIKISLLLRLGETSLAQRVYACLRGVGVFESPSERFVDMAGDWAFVTFRRAVRAHMRGDERLAFADASRLSVAGPKLEAQAAEQGAKPPTDMSGVTHPFFDFLKPIPELLKDTQRRLAAPESPLDLNRLAAQHPNTAERVALLIDHLQDVCAQNLPYSPVVRLEWDPICKAIVGEGDAAVAPLFDTARNSTRFTRTFAFEHYAGERRRLVSVREAAETCLRQILQVSTSDPNDVKSWDAMQAYWKANGDLPLAERWYRTLASDAATKEQWLFAARHIVQHGSEERPEISYLLRLPPSREPMRGESLRSHDAPRVSALLARRVAESTVANLIPHGTAPATFEGGYNWYANSVSLGLALADWDLQAAPPTLKLLMTRVLEARPLQDTGGEPEPLGRQAAALTLARLRAGDITSAAADYTQFLQTMMPLHDSNDLVTVFAPLYLFPDTPTFAQTAETLFNGPHSVWNPVAIPAVTAVGADGSGKSSLTSARETKTVTTYGRDAMIGSRLICLPAFRRQILRELDDDRAAGTAVIRANGQIMLNRFGREEYGGSADLSASSHFPVETPFSVRLCDIYANSVARMGDYAPSGSHYLGTPPFELWWPRAERDTAIADMKTYLVRFGDRFQPMPYDYGYDVFDYTGLHLPARNRAATVADVAKGRAIFSLNDPSARPVALSRPFPVAARWAKNPTRVLISAGGTIYKWHDTEGAIYQAEEVWEKGAWRRYYGFVGLHTMTRVPAEEIVLLGNHDKLFPWQAR